MLSAIDAGRLGEVVAPDTPELWMAAAEWAAYCGRGEEALDEIRRAGRVSPSLRLRAECIRAELAIADGDTATAESVAYSVVTESLATGDRQACVRARIAVVRCKVRDGRYRSAVEDLPRLRREIAADDAATIEQRQFRVAICDHLEAYSRLKLGDTTEALAGAHRAIAEFARVGAGRWEGWARNVVGLALVDLGEHEAALREFERAETCAAALNLAQYMLMSRNNAAIVTLARGRLADAIATLRSSLQIDTGTVADVQCRLLLARALGTIGKRDEARIFAADAIERSNHLTHEETGADARIVAAWLDGSTDRLHRLHRLADEAGVPFRIRACLVYLADLEPQSRPDHSTALLELADQLTRHADELSPLVDRIRARLDVSPIRLEHDTLTIDLSTGLPHLDDAVEAVQRLLVERAMRREDGVQTRAADLLAISRTRLLALRRKLGLTE